MVSTQYGSVIDSVVANREVITNAFDLASFLFITPELTSKYIGTARLRWLASYIAFCLSCVVFLMLFGLFYTTLLHIFGEHGPWPNIITCVVLFPLGIYVVHRSSNLVDSIEASKDWLLACGIVLFILSRIIGLVAGLIAITNP